MSALVDQKLRNAFALQQQGQLAQAETLYREILEAKPDHFDALHMLGVVQGLKGDAESAATLIGRAVKVDPASAAAHANLGNALNALGRHAAALDSYERVLRLAPDSVQTYFNRGNALHSLGRVQESLASYESALQLQPRHAQALNNRGNVLHILERFEEALASYEQALQAEPGYVQALNNRGVALLALGRFDEALASYARALQLEPGYADALFNHGNALQALGRHAEALASYERVLQLKPGHQQAHWNAILCTLLLGDFAKGWPRYELRSQLQPSAVREIVFPKPRWTGIEPLHGKTVLLHGEQGLGDTIQFSRYAGMVADRGAAIVLAVQPELKTLLAQLAGPRAGMAAVRGQVVGAGETLPPFDYYCPLLSLPLAFGTGLDSIPARQAYLQADRRLVKVYGETLKDDARPRIGIAWSGAAAHVNNRNRNVPLARLIGIGSDRVALIALQKDPGTDEDRRLLEAHRIRRVFGADMNGTAAVMENLDLVVTADTAVAHLAGALGKPVWILLPFVPDWRWLLDREDSPWYPSARLFRQPSPGDWNSVITRVKRELEHSLPALSR